MHTHCSNCQMAYAEPSDLAECDACFAEANAGNNAVASALFALLQNIMWFENSKEDGAADKVATMKAQFSALLARATDTDQRAFHQLCVRW